MAKSEAIGNLAAALAKAQAEFPQITKNRTAKVPMKAGGSYSYKYADMSDVLEAVTPALSKNELSLSQSPTIVAEKLMLETTLMHSSGEWITGFYPLASFDRPQEMGSEITYARRYTATAMLGIHADEDDDGVMAQEAKPKPKTSAPIKLTQEQAPGEFVPSFGKYKGQKLKDITVHDLASYVRYIEAQAEESQKAITGPVLAFMQAAAKFIESRTPTESALDQAKGKPA